MQPPLSAQHAKVPGHAVVGNVPAGPNRKKIGEIMVEKGWLSAEDLEASLQEAKRTGQFIGSVLMGQNKISREQLGEALGEQFKVPYMNLETIKLDKATVLSMLPLEFIQKYKLLPISAEGKTMVIAMVEPNNRRAIDEITFMTGQRAKVYVTTSHEYQDLFSQLFQMTASTNLLEEMSSMGGGDFDAEDARTSTEATDLLDNNSPLVKLVNAVIEEALERKASDIHIEPRKGGGCVIRFRVNGILQNMLQVPPNMRTSFITRLKVMARMDIAEHRRPLDGRFSLVHKRQEFNFRVNSLPLSDGQEKLVIRILRPSRSITDFNELGMHPDDIRRIEELYRSPHGIVLICGPTGAGKTTTLYTILNKINDEYRNISTIEDPIELQIEGLNQAQVNNKADFTFASALRSLLRQDPDVIMVGEIRDFDTLESSIHASLTGHLVFSTIHANTTAATVTRLIEMGADGSLLSASLLGIVAQRLVRKICQGCKQPYEASAAEKALIFPDMPEKRDQRVILHKAKGCHLCGNTGYNGRVGLFEIMVIDRKLKQLIGNKAMDIEIEDAAVANGMKTLFASSRQVLLEGQTSLQELVRVLGLHLGRNV